MTSNEPHETALHGSSHDEKRIRDFEYQLAQAQEKISFLTTMAREGRQNRRLALKYKSRAENSRRSIFLALSPWLVLLAPITLPWALIYLLKKRKKRAQENASTTMSKTQQLRYDPRHVAEAFMHLRLFGVKSGIDVLDEDPSSTPQGARALFEAHDAKDDSAWAKKTNDWLSRYSRATIEIGSGTGPRYNRISFSEVPAVETGPKVSVIMPAFNAEHWLEPAVRSILDQSWKNLELLVVNDKSTDGTGALLDRLATTDSRMQVLHNPVNVGPYVSKNTALSFATGDYITGHDADDLALPDRLERQISHLKDDTQTDGIVGQMIRVDEDGLLSFASTVGGMSFDGVHRIAMISFMLRREVCMKFGYWDSVRFGADSEYRARLRTHLGDRIRTVPDLTMICLSAPESLTNDPQHGIMSSGGLSRVRATYRENWVAWHKANKKSVIHRDFSNASRPFEAPPEMLVPQVDIDRLQAHYGPLNETP